MPKATVIEGVMYRTRRGVLVKIPDEWVGRFTTPKTIRQRDSKMHYKLRRQEKWRRARNGNSGPDYLKYKDLKDGYND